MKKFTDAHKEKLIKEIREKMEKHPKKILEKREKHPKKILEKMEKLLKVEFIKFQVADMLGNLKEVTISREEFLENGTTTKDGSSLYSKVIQPIESDMVLVPDLKTLFILPWAPDAATILCNSYYPPKKQGAPMLPFKGCGRNILQKVVRRMEKTVRGLFPNDSVSKIRALFSPEIEFLLLPEDYDIRNIHRDQDLKNNHYFSIPKLKIDEVLKEIVRCLGAMGLKREKYHAEVSTFQYEVGIGYGNVLRIADGVMRAKYIIEKIAEKHGFKACFPPKFNPRVNGCGKHVHQNIVALVNGVKRNIFYDARRKYGLSKFGDNYFAGLLEYIPDTTAITNPLPISFKRLVKDAEAPTAISFDWRNRTASHRGHSEQTEKIRIEARSPDPMCNPYLAYAAMLSAGLAGIEENLKLGKTTKRDYYTDHKDVKQLPPNLGIAVEIMNKSKMLRKGMGNYIIDSLCKLGSDEWNNICKIVTDADIERYII